jgi:DNA-3-methyladenine glycosylase II
MKKKFNLELKGIRTLSPTKNAFASLVRSIIYQQLSGKAAASIEQKFFALFDPNIISKESKRGTLLGHRLKPGEVMLLTDLQFQQAGVSLQKRTYIRDLSDKFLNKVIDPSKFWKMTDEEIKDHLVQVKGIGSWTADMFLIFALNRPNVLPVGDLGIKKGFQKAFNLRSLPDEKKMKKLALEYEGAHTKLSLYLWHILDNGEGLT